MMTLRLNILEPGFRGNPYPGYSRLRRDAPVTQVDPAGFWAISRYDDVVSVIRNPRLFSSQGFKPALEPAWVGYNPLVHSILALDGPRHTQLRALVAQAFSVKAVSRLDARIQQISHTLADGLAPQGEADFVAGFAMRLPAFVIGELLGLEASLHPRFRAWAEDLAGVTPEPRGPEHVRRSITSIHDITGYLAQVIKDRRRAPADDLVTDLLRAEVDGQTLTDREIIDFLALLLVAGLETTVHLLGNSLLFLSEHSDELARLRAEPRLVPRFIEEMLRYDSPVQGVLRVTTSEVTLSGVTIPQGAVVLALLASANRDERHYTEPDRFNLHRDQPSISFGHGAHFCLGAQLARMEARRGLEALLSRFSGFVRTTPTITWNTAITVRGPEALPLRFLQASDFAPSPAAP